jgi:hypothetical protein
VVNSSSILKSGCGGGYDFFGALPLYFALRSMNKKVYLSNLTFTANISKMSGKKYPSGKSYGVAVTYDSSFTNDNNSKYYFPERLVSKWFKENENLEVPIYTLERDAGPANHREVYEEIIKEHDVKSTF